jgi:hypothetical protein
MNCGQLQNVVSSQRMELTYTGTTETPHCNEDYVGLIFSTQNAANLLILFLKYMNIPDLPVCGYYTLDTRIVQGPCFVLLEKPRTLHYVNRYGTAIRIVVNIQSVGRSMVM